MNVPRWQRVAAQLPLGCCKGTFCILLPVSTICVFMRDGKAWMSYGRDHEPALHGESSLSTLLVLDSVDGLTFIRKMGQWFEAPINYYSIERAVGHGSKLRCNEDYAYRSAGGFELSSLSCYGCTDGAPRGSQQVRRASFSGAGVGCTACHGDPTQHLAERGHGAIVNPAKLTPVKRDSVCLQCHLEGDVAIYRRGHIACAVSSGGRSRGLCGVFCEGECRVGGEDGPAVNMKLC